jgi:putative ABC transport system substrate-binding protein
MSLTRRLISMAIAQAIAAPFWLASPERGGAQSLLPATRPIIVSLRASVLFPQDQAAFLQGLRDVGLEEGRDFDLVIRSTEGEPSRSADLIAELIARNPAVVVVQTTPLAVEMVRVTKTIPIVASTITDPVGLGLAQTIAHPGGNFTGVMSTSASTTKLVEVLLQFVPGASRVGGLINPGNIAHVQNRSGVKDELAAHSVTLVTAEARVAADIPTAFQVLRDANVQAMYVGQDPLFNQEAKTIADLALAARLPLAYGFRIMTDAGGLMSYGTSLIDHQRRAGVLAAKIIRGDKPGDLPIEQNAKLELVINMKTAKALGLTVPPIALARAEEVIE